MKTIYSSMYYAGPNGEPREQFKPHMEAVYGFPPIQQVCFYAKKPDGSLDLDSVRAQYLDRLPNGAMAFLDREGVDVEVFQWIDGGLVPNPKNIQAMVDLYDAMKAMRPDIQMAYYGVVPTSYAHLQMDDTVSRYSPNNMPCWAAVETVDLASSIIAERVDYLMPYFYFGSVVSDKSLTYDRVRLWAGSLFQRCRRYWPTKRVVPLMWPNYYDRWKKYYIDVEPNIDDKAFEWTPAILNDIRVPGELFQALVDEMDKWGLEELAVWQEGHQPWDPNADWLKILLRWRGQIAMPQFRFRPSADISWQ